MSKKDPMHREPWSWNSHRLSDRSALFPTSTIITSFPLSDRTSSIHFVVDKKDARSKSDGKDPVSRNTIPIHTRNIKYHNRNGRVSNVRWNQRSESFLRSIGVRDIK